MRLCGFRPTGSLPFRGSMVILALILGLVIGALAVALWARAELGRRNDAIAAASEKLALVELSQAQWNDHLKSLTSDALTSSSNSPLPLGETKPQPIAETLKRYEEAAAQLEGKRLAAVTAVGVQLEAVA